MIPDKERISRRQYLSICFMALISPIIRQMPKVVPRFAAGAGWLSALAAAPWLLLMALLLLRLLKKRAEGEGLGEVILRVWGRVFGRVVLCVYALWLLVYCGFVLRSGADRLLATAYPRGNALVFTLVMAALGLLACLGSVRTLARTANIFRPVMLAALVLVLLFALPDAELSTLLPVSRLDVLPVLISGLPVANVVLILLGFSLLENRVERAPGGDAWPTLRLLALLVVLITLLMAALLANFGPELLVKLPHPFFAMARNISILGSLRRVDALVISLWVLTDFVLVAALQHSAVTALRLVFRCAGRWWLPALGTAASLAFALLAARDSYTVAMLSQKLFPISGACIAFGLFPLTFVVGLIRKRI